MGVAGGFGVTGKILAACGGAAGAGAAGAAGASGASGNISINIEIRAKDRKTPNPISRDFKKRPVGNTQ